jgi:hypothetical protein
VPLICHRCECNPKVDVGFSVVTGSCPDFLLNIMKHSSLAFLRKKQESGCCTLSDILHRRLSVVNNEQVSLYLI